MSDDALDLFEDAEALEPESDPSEPVAETVEAPAEPGPKVWSVYQVNRAVRGLLESSVEPLWVGGEVGSWTRSRAGHCYFTLKDDRAQLRSVMFAREAQRLPSDPDEASDAGTNTEIKQILVENVDDIPDLAEPQEFGDSPFQVGDQNDLENITTDFQSEMKEKEREFEKEKQALMDEMNRIRERESRSDEEKKRLLRDIETSEMKMKALDEEREAFRDKLDSLSTDYEKRIAELHEKYKNKMKKFEDLLKKSLNEINEE